MRGQDETVPDPQVHPPGRRMGIYCKKMGFAASVLRFMFDDGSGDHSVGRIIRLDDTAETIGLEDKDIITAVLERIK